MNPEEKQAALLTVLKSSKYAETGASTEVLLSEFPGWIASDIVQHMNSLSGQGVVDFVYAGDSGRLVFKAKAASEISV